MKSKYLASAALCIAAATGFMACGDDVITVYGDEVYSIVDEIDDSTCTKANEGKMSLEKKSGTLFLCEDGKWTPVNGSEVVDLRCKSSLLKDSTGYNIICDGDTIATVYNGQNGKGSKGSNGLSAYELAKANGLVDTTKIKSEKEWLESLQGENGKDILEQLQEKNLLPDSIQTIEDLLKYLKGENGSAGSNGLSAYELAKANGLVDTTKIKSEKEWLESLQGENGKDLLEQLLEKKLIPDTVTTVAKLLEYLQGKDADEKAITEKLEESLSCKVLMEEDIDPEDEGEPLYLHPDEELGIMIVPVKCGKNVSTLELPMYVKDYALLENLAKHYKKHVVVRIPFIAPDENVEIESSGSSADAEDMFEELWRNLQSTGVAELTVMEMNSSEFSLTGKNFISDLVASDAKPYVVYDDIDANEFNYKVVRLEGDIDITNLIDSVAQFRVTLNFLAWGSVSQMTFNAVVNLKDESENVVIDFLTDYKAARIKELMKKDDAKLATASEQANKELAEALSLKAADDEFPAFESYLPDTCGLKENQSMLLWPAALISGDMAGYVSLNTVYTKYKDEFAKSGKLDQDLPGSVNGTEYKSMFYVDYLVLLEISSDSRYLKEVQGALADAYGLGECNTKNAGVTQSEIGKTKGTFEYFVCIEGKSYDLNGYWEPITGTNIEKFFNEATAAITGEKCDEENKLVSFTFDYIPYRAVCHEKKFEIVDFDDCFKPGEISGHEISGGGINYYECAFDEQSRKFKTTLLNKSISELCQDNQGKIFQVGSWYYDGYFYELCTDASAETNNRQLNLNNNDDLNILANSLVGKCSATNYKKTETIAGKSQETIICLNLDKEYKWYIVNGQSAPIIENGFCTEELMNENIVYRVNVLGQEKSTLTGYKYYKCDCEYWETDCEQETCPQNVECSWKYASENEIKLDKACNYDNMGDFSKDGEYVCKIVDPAHNDKHDWGKTTAKEWCQSHGKALYSISSILEAEPSQDNDYIGICDDVPDDETTYILTAGSGSSWAADWDEQVVTAEQKAKDTHQMNESSNSCTQTDIIDFLDGVFYLADNGKREQVHDLICKNGKLRQAANEQEACNTAFKKTDKCKYMQNAYEYDGTEWIPLKVIMLSISGEEDPTSDKLFTAKDKSEYYLPAKGSHNDSYPSGLSTLYYSNRSLYSVSRYCETKGNYCYIEGQEPEGKTSSFDCEFLVPYTQKTRYYCNDKTGEWEKNNKITTAEQYCDAMMNFYMGVSSCSIEAASTYCNSSSDSEQDICSNNWFTFLNPITQTSSCEAPSDMTPSINCENITSYSCSFDIENSEENVGWRCAEMN